MRATNRTLQTLATAVFAGLIVPGLLRAQTVTKSAPTPEFVEARAEVNIQDRSGFREAKKMYLKAAEIRSETDPQGVADLLAAAGIMYYGGDRTGARNTFVQAGDRALGMGDVAKAADSYLRAAIIANEQRDPSRDELIARAYRLASSPLLTVAQRDRILTQFVGPQLAAGTR